MTITGISKKTAPARRTAGSPWAVSVTFLCLLLVTLVVLSQPWRGHETLAYLLTYVLPPLLAGSIVVTRLRATPPSRDAWSLLAIALFLTAGGEALEAALRLGLPLAGGALLRDALWLAYYPAVGAALLLLTRQAAPRPLLQSWLEAAMAGGATLAVGLLLITDLWASSPSGLPPVFPLADIALLSLALLLGEAVGWRISPSVRVLFLGLASFAVVDFAYFLRPALFDSTPGAEMLNVGWPVSALLIGLAAHMPEADRPRQERERSRSRFAPIALVTAAVGGVLLAHPADIPQRAAELAAAAALLAGAWRLQLALRDSRRDAEALRNAHVDTLTGLPTRAALEAAEQIPGVQTSAVLIDLSSFRTVNEGLGHAAGDRLLQIIADRLLTTVRKRDVLTRIGGDRFMLLLSGAPAAAAERIARDAIACIGAPLAFEGETLRLTACAGVAVQEAAETTDVLLRKAESALHDAKRIGEGSVAHYEESSQPSGRQRLALRTALKRELDAGGEDFPLHYQPIVDSAGRTVAFEALLRWQRGDELAPPATFIPELIAAGEIGRATDLSLARCARELTPAIATVPVTVNIHPSLLPGLADRVAGIVDAAGTPAGGLILEITEDGLVRDPTAARREIDALRDLGIHVWLDDFGSGWANLGALHDLAVAGIKLDRTLVMSVQASRRSRAIVAAVASLARELDLLVIYEGVSERAALDALTALQPALVQGFLHSQALPLHDLKRWLDKHPPAPLRVSLQV
jgi:diguanylate cyclase (GGDEF)-like protein